MLAAIAFHQPVSRDGLKAIFGTEISRDLIGRLAGHELIVTGPREPRCGAPHTFVTTETFLAAFGMQSLRDLPDPGQLADDGLAGRAEAPALQKGGDPSAQDRHPPEADRQAAPERPDRVP